VNSKAPAIARAAAILRLLGRSDEPLGVNAIARELELVPSTCLYVLRALVAEELVAFDPAAKRYSLAAGVLTLARGWLRRDRFADLAQGRLDALARHHEVTMLGVQIFGLDHIIVVAKAEGGRNFQLSAQIGSRFPALISATGRCIAAFGGHADAAIARRFGDLRWDNPPSFDEWQTEVSAARTDGFAVDDGRYIEGVTVVAAPVFHSGGAPTHALVAVGLGSGWPAERTSALAAAMRGNASQLSQQLGG
jgi:DNA-binding IclR family transcriptional regulator